MSEYPAPELIASCTITLPNRKVAGRVIAGKMVKAGNAVPLEGLDEGWADRALDQGLIYIKEAPPRLAEVKAMRREEELNVSATKDEAGNEKNPLDGGVDLSASDPGIQSKLDEIAAEQEENGVDPAANVEALERTVEVNAETGVVKEEGGDPEFDDDDRQADAQVSE